MFKPGDLVRIAGHWKGLSITKTSEHGVFVVSKYNDEKLYVATFDGEPVRFIHWSPSADNDWNPDCWEKLSPFEERTYKIIHGLP